MQQGPFMIAHLVLLIFAFVFGCVATWLSGPGLTWHRALCAGFTALVASMIQW
jgi:hypothetical protein